MKNVINYAREANSKLMVTITGREEKPVMTLMTADGFKKSIERHCAWFGTQVSYERISQYEAVVRLLNGIEFNAIIR